MWRAGNKGVILTSTTQTPLSLLHSRPITCVAAASRVAPHPPDLVKWVRREGGFVHEAVKIGYTSPHGLGLVASADIPLGSDLIGLPPHLPLQFNDGSSSYSPASVLASLAHRVPEELWTMRLGLKLLQERAKAGSFWWPYISNLPETYSVPIFFQGEDIKNLQYAPVLHQVNKRCRFLLDFDKEVKGVVANLELGEHPFVGQDVDASSLGWAISAVSSRAFRLHGDKASGSSHDDVPMMLPLIDMCNHSFNPNAKIIQDQDAGKVHMLVKVIADKNIKRDDPVELNYGCLSNDLFLLDYGFVIAGNPYDCIELKYDGALLDAASMTAGLSSAYFSSPTSWQKVILAQLKLDGEAPDLKVTLGGPNFIDGRFLAALRVLHAEDAEVVTKHDLSTLQSLNSEAPLGNPIEAAVFRTVIGLCMIILEHFPTKIADDEALLKQGVSSSSELAIQFRIQKKSLIIGIMMEMSKRLKMVQSKLTAAAQL